MGGLPGHHVSVALRRLAPVAFAVAIVVGSLAGPAPTAAADLTVTAAEQAMLDLLNGDRTRAGLVPVRVDSRLSAIARARSTDMASKGYFGHTQPDGRTVFDIIPAQGIRWYGAGEIIAWNNWPTLAESAAAANSGWLGSPGHRAIVMSTSYNYIGVGLAIDAASGKKFWTGVFMKGPDRTGGWVTLKPVSEPGIARVASARYRTTVVSWRGGDVRLVVLTAGFRKYQVQARTDGGAWVWFRTATTNTSQAIRLWAGHTYEMRVRACDRVGNCGAWRSVALSG